jgi:hypothetical protein
VASHSLGIAHATRQDPVRVLDEMKRTAVEQLGGVPSGLYRPIEDALHDSAQRAGLPGARRTEHAALLALRQRNAAYVMRFRQLIAQGFDEFRALPATLRRPSVPLGLVEEAQLDYHLAGQRLAESIGKRYERPLQMLDGRLEALAAALDQPQAGNPIGAARLAGAFIETFRDAEIPDSLRPLLFRQYEQELGKVLGDLYGRMNTLLAAAGYGIRDIPSPRAPETPAAPEQAPTGPEAAEQRAEAQPAPSADDAEDAARGRFGKLREKLRNWREGLLHGNGGGVPADGAPERRLPPRRELAPAEVVSVASLVQSDPPEPYVRALAGAGSLADAIREQLTEGARRLGLDPDQTALGPAEEDAIDLIGLLFESLFRTHGLLDRSRRLYARLVVPYLKVALAGEDLFVRREHPARRLLDAITEACEGNDGATPQDRELLERAAGAAQRIVADFQEDLAIFELAHAELEALLAQHRQRAEVVERRASEAVHGRERLMQARLQAGTALSRRLAQTPVTATVADFLVEHWQHHVVQTLLRDGLGSQRHGDALALGDELVEVDRIAALGSGAAVADRLIALQPAITECLASSGLDEDAAREWLAGLVAALAQPDLPREIRHVPPPQLADEDGESARLQLAGGNDGLDFDPEVAQRMRRLAPGDWLRLFDLQGDATSAKVAWISPLTARFLLVNRRGMRVLVASAEQLAALARENRLLVDSAQAPFDEALRHLEGRLGRAVGEN